MQHLIHIFHHIFIYIIIELSVIEMCFASPIVKMAAGHL